MNLAILFSCYKDLDLSRRRLRRLRKLHPRTPLFVLYGGPFGDAHLFHRELSPFADDFHVFGAPWRPEEKWKRFDALLVDWHLERGKKLAWDTVVLVQWDCILLAPVQEIFADLAPEELVLPGLRKLDGSEGNWSWLHDGESEKKREFERFLELLGRETSNARDHLHSCVMITGCLPRSFLDRYSARTEPETGFLEYAIPTYAKLWGYPVKGGEPRFRALYRDPAVTAAPFKERALSPFTQEPGLACMLLNALDPQGARIFHPYRRKFLWF